MLVRISVWSEVVSNVSSLRMCVSVLEGGGEGSIKLFYDQYYNHRMDPTVTTPNQ